MNAFGFGTAFCGKADAVGEDAVYTKFWLFGFPVLPIQSYYGRRTDRGVVGMPIPLHRRSVLLGYLRGWLILPLFGLLAGAIVGGGTSLGLGLLIFVASAVWLAAALLSGHLDPSERRRRLLLNVYAPTTAPPAVLPPDVAEDTSRRLLRELAAAGIRPDVVSDPTAGVEPVRRVCVTAAYAQAASAEAIGPSSGEWARTAALAWERLQALDDATLFAPAGERVDPIPLDSLPDDCGGPGGLPGLPYEPRFGWGEWIRIDARAPALPRRCCVCLAAASGVVHFRGGFPAFTVSYRNQPPGPRHADVPIPTCDKCRTRGAAQGLLWAAAGVGAAYVLILPFTYLAVRGNPNFVRDPVGLFLFNWLGFGVALAVPLAYAARKVFARPPVEFKDWDPPSGEISVRFRNGAYRPTGPTSPTAVRSQ